MNMLEQVLDLFQKFVVIGGALWLAWGAIVAGIGLKDSNGPDIKSGLWQVVGGGMIIAAGALFGAVAL
ncbi:hypothetical protein DD236_01320 [Ancrocorticia populi]|uniref:Uncharacterized protein n=2 Tax=Ancrocorticia populi TaxID=2175228 RepID=A0A2V1K6J9_9ACTO|nr:hypothetical protein DD236_01320 [Ancrocorticia populi]